MEQGTIGSLWEGWGFLRPANGRRDLFFPASAVEGLRFEELRLDMAVEFEAVEHKSGRRAVRVRLVKGDEAGTERA